MGTYTEQFLKDSAWIIDVSKKYRSSGGMYPYQAGAFSERAKYLAGRVDAEYSVRLRLVRDPAYLIREFFSQPGGPTLVDIALLLSEMQARLLLLPELRDAHQCVEEARYAVEDAVDAEERRAAEDLDRAAAAASDEAHDRKIDAMLDAGLIGRAEFLPAEVK